MRATITPKDRPAFSVASSLPRWEDKAVGGYGSATIPCRLEHYMLDRIVDADVRLSGPAGDCYAGNVWSYKGGELQCYGAGSRLAQNPARRLYAKADIASALQDWPGVNPGAFYKNLTDGRLNIGHQPGVTMAPGDGSGRYYLGDVELQRIVLTVGVQDVSFGAYIYPLDADGARLGATYYSKTSTGTETGVTYTFPDNTYGFEMYGANHAGVDLTVLNSDRWVAFYSMTLYGYADTTTPAHVLDDILGRHPNISTSREFIASDEAALAHLDVTGSDADVVKALTALTGRPFAVRLRDVGWTRVPVGIYAERPTVAAYHCTHDGRRVIADLDGGSLEDMLSQVLGDYTDVNGRQRTVTVNDTDVNHYLVQIGRTADEDGPVARRYSFKSTSRTEVQAGCEAILAALSSISHSGRITINGQGMTTAAGARVHTSQIEAGQLVTAFSTAWGTVTGYGDHVQHIGPDIAVITIDAGARIPEHVRRIVR